MVTGERTHAVRALLCALAALALVVSFTLLTGCKYSDVLTQHTEDPSAEIDENAEPIYESNPEGEMRDDLVNLSINEAEDEDTQVAKLPHYDPNAPDNGPTKQLKRSSETPHDEEASEGDENGDEQQTGDGEGTQGGNANTTGDSEDDDGEGEGTGDTLTSDDETDGTESSEAGVGDSTVVVSEEGTNEDTAKGTVAAVGEYATIAQMLGGAGALAACDRNWFDARNADGCFSGELDRVQVAFSGDGSESGSCDVDALINTIQPSVVLWDGKCPALSDSEREKLEGAGITVQSVPTIGDQGTEDQDVVSAVRSVASVLDGAGGLQYDPLDVLDKYIEFHDSTLTQCYESNDGYSYKVTDGSYNQLYQKSPLAGLNNSTTTRVTTAFVDSTWTPSVAKATVAQTATTTDGGTIRLAHDGQSLVVSDGVGLSVKSSTQDYMLIDYYLQLSGVVNNAYDAAKPEPKGKPYILMPGNTASFGTSSSFASRLTASAFFYSMGDSGVIANWHVLGNDDFKTVLVKTDDIAKAFVKSSDRSDGLYRMESSYRIIVVPSGVAGLWSEGHLDSFLLAPWAFQISGGESNRAASLDAAKSYMDGFYSTFLRCEDTSNAVLNWDTSYVAKSG